MKTKVFLQFISKGLFLILALLLTACLGTALAAINGMSVASGGGSTILGGGNDTHTVSGVSSEINMEEIYKEVALFNPSRFPLDTIFRQHAKKVSKTESLKVSFYSQSSAALLDTLATDGSTTESEGTSAGTALKSYTYTTGNGATYKWLKVNNPKIWAADSIFKLNDLSTNPSGNVSASSLTNIIDVVFYVEQVDQSASAIKAIPLNGIKGLNGNANSYVFPNFTSSAELYKLGNAKADRAIKEVSLSYYPTKDTNYCQNFIKTVEESEFQKMQLKEVQWDLRDMVKMMALSIRAEIEAASLWGVKAEITNANTGDTRYSMNGLTRYMTNTNTYGTGGTNRTMSKDDLLSIFETVFVGNSGSTKKVLFAGAGLVKSLMQFQLDNKTYMKTQAREEWGVQFSDWSTEFGIFSVVHHPLMTELGWRYRGAVVDLEHVYKQEFVKMKQENHDFKSSGTANSNATSLQECSTVFLQYPEAHLLIKPKA
jgi:hypothetical protein